MKAITIHQPFAELIARGVKTIETRQWKTLHRGPIAIHASSTRYRSVDAMVWGTALQCAPYRGMRLLCSEFSVPPANYQYGAVIAIAELVGIEPSSQATWISKRNRELGDFSPGRYCWYLRDVRRLEQPIPARGTHGLWEWPEGDDI